MNVQLLTLEAAGDINSKVDLKALAALCGSRRAACGFVDYVHGFAANRSSCPEYMAGFNHAANLWVERAKQIEAAASKRRAIREQTKNLFA